MIQTIRSARDIQDSVCLEIGAGWEPALPLLFSLCGARDIIMTDLHKLCTEQTMTAAIEGVIRKRDEIASGLGLSPEFISSQLTWHKEQGLGECLKRFRIRYFAPCDCTNLPVPSDSIDIVYSRAVLEHIPPATLRGIFVESTRVLSDDGLACHFIDCSDHWEHNDKRISRINFLRYSDRLYRWTCVNPMNYQNRMRHSEYVQLLNKSGFKVIKEDRNVDLPAIQALAGMKLAPCYRHFAPEDLATVDSFLVARKADPTALS